MQQEGKGNGPTVKAEVCLGPSVACDPDEKPIHDGSLCRASSSSIPDRAGCQSTYELCESPVCKGRGMSTEGNVDAPQICPNSGGLFRSFYRPPSQGPRLTIFGRLGTILRHHSRCIRIVSVLHLGVRQFGPCQKPGRLQ